jgi:hypothetical protein
MKAMTSPAADSTTPVPMTVTATAVPADHDDALGQLAAQVRRLIAHAVRGALQHPDRDAADDLDADDHQRRAGRQQHPRRTLSAAPWH